jgi:hypothetical protein
MNDASKKTIASVSASILSVAFVAIVNWLFGVEDEALVLTMVAFLSAVNSLSIYGMLNRLVKQRR